MNIKYIFVCLIYLFICIACEREKKPLFNIAHMVNTIAEVGYYLEQGANAIETDVNFASNGTPTYMYHGIPCDCFRICDRHENADKFLNYIRLITTEGHKKFRKRFALLFLDLKISKLPKKVKPIAGEQLAIFLLKHLFEFGKSKSKINVQIAVNYVDDSDFIVAFHKVLKEKHLEHLNKRIGWDVSVNQPLNEIVGMWQTIQIVSNIWQGDGITNCLSPFRKTKRLRHSLALQSHCKPDIHPHCIRKVYQWTIDLPSKLRRALRLGVDGIITNKPLRLYKILLEKEFSDNYRLADLSDNPWQR